VEKREDDYHVKNNECSKGRDYAISELTNPVRHVTSTIAIDGNLAHRLPVRTNSLVPKGKIFAVMNEIKQVKIKNPVYAGQILIKNVAGTEADIIASSHSFE
jgi:CxxC motif-containing protein